MPDNNQKIQCERCGTCCMKGGPALHAEDINLLQHHIVDRDSLITIRRGEPVISPGHARLESSHNEIVKLKGNPSQWTCTFYTEKNASCAIYDQRPLECVLLKCWDTDELESVINKDLLSRFDIISKDEPIIPFINKLENECSLELLGHLFDRQTRYLEENMLTEFNELVNIDLTIRTEAVNKLNLSLDLELFYFGRPVFKILSQFDLIPKEVNNRVILVPA